MHSRQRPGVGGPFEIVSKRLKFESQREPAGTDGTRFYLHFLFDLVAMFGALDRMPFAWKINGFGFRSLLMPADGMCGMCISKHIQTGAHAGPDGIRQTETEQRRIEKIIPVLLAEGKPGE
jgi:hypothetical protein